MLDQTITAMEEQELPQETKLEMGIRKIVGPKVKLRIREAMCGITKKSFYKHEDRMIQLMNENGYKLGYGSRYWIYDPKLATSIFNCTP